MTQVTVELKTNAVKTPIEIKWGQYVEIDGSIYVCTRVTFGGKHYSQLTSLDDGNRWGKHQEGDTYRYKDEYPIRFIDKIKITEE